MPRKARIDAPGAVHHIMARGIERRKIFRNDDDRNEFLERLEFILSETHTPCHAWALIPNHFHLLLKTGSVPIATAMRRLLSGYAQSFNRRHRRHGHLFQDRYKSILCQQDTYLRELVRSAGGWAHVKAMRKSGLFQKADQPILGDGDFVQRVLQQSDERLEPTYALKTKGYDFDKIVQRVAELLDMPKAEVVSAGKRRSVVKARSIVCYWAHDMRP